MNSHEHPLMREAGQAALPAYLRISPQPQSRSPGEEYAECVFWSSMNIMSCLEQLEAGLFYLSHYPATDEYAQSGFTYEEYLGYHIEGYYIRRYSLLDRAYALVNCVMQLGLPNRRLDTVPEMGSVKGHATGTVLRGFKRMLEADRTIRNGIAHREPYSDAQLRMLAFINRFGSEVVAEDLVQKFRRSDSETRLDEYSKSVKIAADTMMLLFDTLLPEWRARVG